LRWPLWCSERDYVTKLTARLHTKLREDFAQVILNRARADEQLGSDLRVCGTLRSETRDAVFLSGQHCLLGASTAHLLTQKRQCSSGSSGECLGPDVAES